MLYDNQKIISDSIYKNIEDKRLYNVPTGRGKTFILMDVAKKLFNQDGKNVIISVPNNNLVREMFEVSKLFGLDEKSVNIVIGKDNYISKEKLLFYKENFEGLEKYITRSSFDKFVSFATKQDVVYFDDFDQNIEYTDIAGTKILKNMLAYSDEESSPKISDGITITNHFYLLSKASYDKNFDISNNVVLVDEVHAISDVAEIIFTSNFSTFEFKNQMSQLLAKIDELDVKGKITLTKNVKTLFVKANNLHNKYLNYGKVGTYETKTQEVEDFKNEVLKILNSKEYSYINKKVKKITNIIPFSQYQVVQQIKENTEKNILGVYYSPSKGYPTLKSSKKNALGELHFKFWKKIKYFAGLSATVTSSFTPNKYEKIYGYERLGMLEQGREDYEIEFYDRLFPKENINIYLPDKESPKPSNLYEDKLELSDKYYNYIADRIHSTCEGKNSMVLCGGYKEASFLAKVYKAKYLTNNIIVASPNEKTSTTVSKFKKDGGILFATRNYNTGISLEGNLLEKLYILKYPFVDFTTKKWLELKIISDKKYYVNKNREMLIALMQTLGRIQRTKNDTGDVYILDNRHYTVKKNIRNNIEDIINNYGLLHKDIPSIVSKKDGVLDSSKKSDNDYLPLDELLDI